MRNEMLPVIVLFWLLLGWSMYDGTLDPRETVVFVTLWLIIVGGCYLLGASAHWTIVPLALLDIILVLKIFGGDVQIR
jgi:hypothetical protein